MIYVENKKRKIEKIKEQYPNADILDITSSSELRYAQILSPFYPHGNIPIPFTDGLKATCVEVVWQGLKRTVRMYGKPLGHRKGVYGKELLNYFDARMLIYIPTYKWVLDNVPEVHNVLMRIKERSKDHDIVFLDYNTNTEFRDTSSPLSHAGLVKLYIEGNYPKEGATYTPFSDAEIKQRKNEIKESKKVSKKRNKSNVEQLNIFKNE